jgi:hypothetical protein
MQMKCLQLWSISTFILKSLFHDVLLWIDVEFTFLRHCNCQFQLILTNIYHSLHQCNIYRSVHLKYTGFSLRNVYVNLIKQNDDYHQFLKTIFS